VKSTTDRTSSADAASGTKEPSPTLRMVRRAGYAVLAVQLVCFGAWSVILYDHFSLTRDFAMGNQVFFEIAHGNLDPVNSIYGVPAWQVLGSFIQWPQALFYWVFPSPVTLLWLQDIAVVVAEAVAFTWMCELAQKYRPGRKDAAVLAAAGLVLLVANPWTWWSISFDWHVECLAVMFLVLLARDMAHGRRRAWVWAVLLLSCGDFAASYVIAVGLTAILAGRRSRLPGLGLGCLGLAWLVFLRLVHGDVGSPLFGYTYLESPRGGPFSVAALAKGLVLYPGRWYTALLSKRSLMWRNVGSSGWLGFGFLWVLPTAVVVLGTNNLIIGTLFAQPSYQSLPLYILLPIGTVAVLGWLAGRPSPLLAGRARVAAVAAMLAGILVLVPALTMAVTWLPQVRATWLKVDTRTASALQQARSRIPGSAEVIASQGVVGAFSTRVDVHDLFAPGEKIALDGKPVYVVITPYAGIETLAPGQQLQLVSMFSGPLHAKLLLESNNVWLFRWTPPRSQGYLVLPSLGS
jgi:hypothetical protein